MNKYDLKDWTREQLVDEVVKISEENNSLNNFLKGREKQLSILKITVSGIERENEELKSELKALQKIKSHEINPHKEFEWPIQEISKRNEPHIRILWAGYEESENSGKNLEEVINIIEEERIEQCRRNYDLTKTIKVLAELLVDEINRK